jgi:hypothetical protein
MSEQHTVAFDSSPTNDTLKKPSLTSSLSRRSLLKRGGISAAALLLLATTNRAAAAGVVVDTLRKAIPEPKAPDANIVAFQAIADNAKQQFPYYADGPWDQQQYYSTISATRRWWNRTYQMADIDGDGRDELVARGPGGMLVNRYDPDTGQWVPLPDGPTWSDAYLYDQVFYYGTIILGDVNGDGQAELMGRDHEGLKTWAYDPQANTWKQLAKEPGAFPVMTDGDNPDVPWRGSSYYPTIQCADIDGDGRAELIGRSETSIVAWRYDPTSDRWDSLPNGPTWSDANEWNQPQYYLTIQCADVDGDGFPELLGRSAAGMEVWKFKGNGWKYYGTNTALSDANSWGLPEFYRTIQCADIDGDGRAELIARRHDAISVQKFDPSNFSWVSMPDGPPWSDTNGFGATECYETIQCADIDGDGAAELLGRGPNGVEVWKYTSSGTWQSLPPHPQWSDANNWNQVQHYGTMQSARVLLPGFLGFPETPDDPGYTGNGIFPQAVLMGRGPLGMQTWRYIDYDQGWTQTSAPFPSFTTEQQAAYHALGDQIHDPLANDIRATYNSQSFAEDGGRFSVWQNDLYFNPSPGSYDQSPRPHCNLPKPDGISQEDWDYVTWQIWWELQWVKNVTDWYGQTKMGKLVDSTAINSIISLQNVANYLNIPSDDTLQVTFTVLALVGSIAAAILSGGASLVAEGAIGVASAVAGGVSAAFSTAAGFVTNGNGAFQTAYNDLENKLQQSYLDAGKNNSALLAGITGGRDLQGNRFIGDYGRLKLIGQWIQDQTWRWITDPTDGGTEHRLGLVAARGYALYVWQALLGAQPWYVWGRGGHGLPIIFPPVSKYVYQGEQWLSTASLEGEDYPPTSTLSALFDSQPEDAVFPMGVPLNDVYEGQHGWHWLPSSGVGIDNQKLAPPAKDVDVRTAVVLSRDSTTQEIVAAVTLRNHGMSPAANVEISEARLGTQAMRSNHVVGHLRLFFGQPQTITLRFPSAAAGQRVALRITGQHLGGAFGGSFRVTLP